MQIIQTMYIDGPRPTFTNTADNIFLGRSLNSHAMLIKRDKLASSLKFSGKNVVEVVVREVKDYMDLIPKLNPQVFPCHYNHSGELLGQKQGRSNLYEHLPSEVFLSGTVEECLTNQIEDLNGFKSSDDIYTLCIDHDEDGFLAFNLVLADVLPIFIGGFAKSTLILAAYHGIASRSFWVELFREGLQLYPKLTPSLVNISSYNKFTVENAVTAIIGKNA